MSQFEQEDMYVRPTYNRKKGSCLTQGCLYADGRSVNMAKWAVILVNSQGQGLFICVLKNSSIYGNHISMMKE